jgi:hypothetical protein
MKKILFMPCPTYSLFPEAPPNQSGCKLIDCPRCFGKMWISKKKRILRKRHKFDELLCACYECFIEFANDNAKDIQQAELVKL